MFGARELVPQQSFWRELRALGLIRSFKMLRLPQVSGGASPRHHAFLVAASLLLSALNFAARAAAVGVKEENLGRVVH